MMGLDACDDDVYNNGVSLGFFDMPKKDAEDYCKKLTAETGNKHDWHYFAGRVHVKVLLPDNAATVPPKVGHERPVLPKQKNLE